MKKIGLSLVFVGFLYSAGGVSSQTKAPVNPAAAPAKAGGADPVALLRQIKADNAVFLEKQDTVLKAMDVLGEEARQLRIFAKRG